MQICPKLHQIRYHKDAGTKMHKCLVGFLVAGVSLLSIGTLNLKDYRSSQRQKQIWGGGRCSADTVKIMDSTKDLRYLLIKKTIYGR